MAKRRIIDPHHHLWDTRNHLYPWLSGPPFAPSVAGDVGPISSPYLAEDFLADTRDYDVVKTVHVDAGWNPDDLVGETRWLQSVAETYGFPQGIVAKAELHAENVEAILAGHAESPNLRGIRHILNWDPDPNLTFTSRSDLIRDENWRRGYALLEKYGLGFDLQVYPWQMHDAAELAGRFPGIPMILNHTGMPLHQHNSGLDTWRKGMRELAAHEHVSVKISGLGMVNWHWDTDSIRPLVLATIEIFGVDRCMFASNFPVDSLFGTYSDTFAAFEAIVSDFSADEQDALFRANAERIYRI